METTGKGRVFTDAEQAHASDETVINGAPFVTHRHAVADWPAYWDAYLNDQGSDLDDRLNKTEAADKI